MIFEITYCEYLSKISSLSIYNDEFEKCTVSGFPKVNDDYKGLAYIPSEFIHSDKNYYFEFDPKKILFNSEDTEVDVIGGISGGGVFVKGNDGQVYLAGIETGLYGVNNLEAVYVIKIIEKINEKVDTKIPTGGFKPLKGFEYQSLSLEFLANNLKNDYIKSMEREEDILQVLDDENNEENDKLEKNFKQTRENLKILSISYLYRGIKFNGYNNYKATANFKKAMLLNKEEVEKYFILAKSKRKPNQKQIDKNLNNDIENILIEIDKLKGQIENTNDYELLEELYIDLIYLLGKTNQHDELLKYRKRLIDLYIENKEFHQAERELKRKSDLDKNYIGQKLRDIYLNEKYTKKLNNEEIAKKLFYLLALLEDESEKDKIRKKIDDLNLYNQNMLVLNEEFSTMKYQIKDYQSKIETLTGMLVNGTKNKDILEQVLQTDENISKKIDERTYEITQKLDEVKISIRKTNSQELNNFLDNVYRSNQSLVSKIQTMYHQNDRASKQAFIILNNSIKSMNEKIEECLNRPVPDGKPTSEDSNNNQVDIEKIIKESNLNFYKAIQCLYEKDSDSYNRKLLEMSIAFTKREHELHIENLKESHKNEILEIDKMYQKEVITLDKKMKNLVDTLKGITLKYQDSENISMKKNKELIFLKEEYKELEKSFENDSKTNLTEKAKQRFQEKINLLSTKIVKLENDLLLKEKDVELKESKFKEELSSIKLTKSENFLKESLEISNKTSWNLLKLDDRYEEKIKKLEDKLNEIKFNPKNKKQLRKYLKKILNFEKKLDEIKRRGDVYPINVDPNITLHLLESDLEKIENIMSKRKSKLYTLYCIIEAIILGVMAMVSLLLYEPFWEIYKRFFEYLGLI